MKISFELLNKTEIQEIHDRSIEILKNTGMRIESSRILGELKKIGCQVEMSSNTVWFTPQSVENAIEENRKNIASKNCNYLINGVTSEKSEGDEIKAKLSGGCEVFLNWENQKIQSGTENHFLDFVRIGEQVPEISFIGNPIVVRQDGAGKEIPESMRRIRTAAMLVKNTKKVGSMEVWDEREIDIFIEMGTVVRGTQDEFFRSPCLITAKETISPLFLDSKAADILCAFAARKLPCTIIPMPISGMSAPVSMLGSVILGNAEILGVITALHALYPDVIVGGGTISGVMDMQTAVASFSAPEAILQDIAIAETHEKLYGLNYLIGTGYTDANYPNPQLLFEKSLKFFMTWLSGRYTYPVGLLSSGSIFSMEQALVDIEICRMIHGSLNRSFGFENIAEITEIIRNVGIRGNTIQEEHTFNNFRQNWLPEIMDRTSFASIEDSRGKDIYKRAKERKDKLLAGNNFWHIDGEKSREIDSIVKSAEKTLLH
jgi:trimethylamine---corrinoid protein Co-methyltransferase